MSTKKERAQEVLNDLLNLAPPMVRNLVPLLSTQFLPSFDQVPDEDIDQLLDTIRDKLDYIETGDTEEA